MRNKSISDFVASTMNGIINSSSHQSLFNPGTKLSFASENCEKCKKSSSECSCQDDNDASTQDDEVDSKEDENKADDDLTSNASFGVAIDSLLTASATLDSLGFSKAATISVKLAELVVEAKKKDADKDKEKAKLKAQKEKEAAQIKKEKELAQAKKEKEAAKAKALALKEKEAKEKAKQKEKEAKEKAKQKK